MNKCGKLLLVCLLGGASVAPASITWGTAQNVADATDVSTNGTLAYAYTFTAANASTAAYTVNGVLFGFDDISDGDVGGDMTFNSEVNIWKYNSGLTTTQVADGNYKNLLYWGGYSNQGKTISLNNLTPGKSYEVQLWAAKVNSADVATYTSDASRVELKLDPAQYVIGTFTAGVSGAESIAVAAGAPINAIQVRAIPEPATLGMLGVGFMTVLAVRRKSMK